MSIGIIIACIMLIANILSICTFGTANAEEQAELTTKTEKIKQKI